MKVNSYEAVVYSLLAVGAVAHPGGDVHAELEKMQEHHSDPERRTLAHCRRQLEESGYYEKEFERRRERSNMLRAENGHAPLAARDIDSVFGSSQPVSQFLARQVRPSCITDPEVTEGPFYVAGELIRSDVTSGSKGVPLHLDINVIDTTTCTPIPNIYVELWGANSTGVYTGVVAKTNGAGLAAPEEINNNALRGLQPTSANGTATFKTIVPGHYTGRAIHLHTIIHHGATLLPNNTIAGGTISHVGQFYFDQNLLKTVEATAPYNTNKQQLVLNANDMLFNQGKRGGDNPVIQTTLVASSIEGGLYGFIEVGVNPKAQQKPQPVNRWTATGGVPVPGSMWAGYPWNKIRAFFGL